jgi:hypothetical protein
LDALKQNSRRFYVRTAIMIVIALALTLFGTFYFSYDNPIINTTAGNIQALALLALIAIDVGWYFRDITRIENKRQRLIAQLENPALAPGAQAELDDPVPDGQPALESAPGASATSTELQEISEASNANGQ